MSGWSEDRLHRWLARRGRPRVVVGSAMHDAAVLARANGRDVVCVDQTIEGVHFAPDAAAKRVGAKACARALSDLAATAARPRAVVCAISAPGATEEHWIRLALEGLATEAERHGAELVGGDVACTPDRAPRSLVVTALGSLPGARKPPGRDRARGGQVLVLTGAVGGSSSGRHLAIEPRITEGAWLYARGATAMMDVSDGLAWDVFRLARSAGVRAVLDAVPVHDDARSAARESGREPLDHALHDGEDHELIASVPRSALERLLGEAPERCPGLAVIGRITRGSGLTIAVGDEVKEWTPDSGGWRHGD